MFKNFKKKSSLLSESNFGSIYSKQHKLTGVTRIILGRKPVRGRTSPRVAALLGGGARN